ncbi:MAG: hypothetical protein QM695_11130 [Micropruina sp.]
MYRPARRLKFRRRLAFALALFVGLTGINITFPPEAASLEVAPMAKSYDEVVNGDYILVGNGVLACDPTKAHWSTGKNPDCKPFHGGTISGDTYVNDYLWMRNADVELVVEHSQLHQRDGASAVGCESRQGDAVLVRQYRDGQGVARHPLLEQRDDRQTGLREARRIAADPVGDARLRRRHHDGCAGCLLPGG